MKKGTIKNWNAERGFGFIQPDQGGQDVFFHKSVVRDAGYELAAGVPLEYDDKPGNRPGKTEATQVVLKGFAEETPQPSPSQRAPAVPGAPAAAATRPNTLPAQCVFTSFYTDGNSLDPRIFFEAAETAAAVFRQAGLKSTQFRQLYQGFLAFVGPLQEGRLAFDTARDRFGVIYCERVVRQRERNVLPSVVKELIDAHRDLALRDEREMRALFRYLTNIYCYFGESDRN
jgi:cold shock protein